MIRRGGRRMEAHRFWSSTDGGGMGRVGRVEGGRRAGFSPSLLGHPPPTLTYLLAHRLQASRTYARAHCMPPLNALSHSLRPYVRTSASGVRAHSTPLALSRSSNERRPDADAPRPSQSRDCRGGPGGGEGRDSEGDGGRRRARGMRPASRRRRRRRRTAAHARSTEEGKKT